MDWAFDLDHKAYPRGKMSHEVRGRPEQLMTFISHGTIFHNAHQRPLLAMEHLLAHGIMPSQSLMDEYGHKCPVDFWSMLRHGVLSPSHIKSMSGNMWHIPVFGTYIMYLLSALEMTGDHCKVKRMPIQTIDDSDDDDVKTPMKRARLSAEVQPLTSVKQRDLDRAGRRLGLPTIVFGWFESLDTFNAEQ